MVVIYYGRPNLQHVKCKAEPKQRKMNQLNKTRMKERILSLSEKMLDEHNTEKYLCSWNEVIFQYEDYQFYIIFKDKFNSEYRFYSFRPESIRNELDVENLIVKFYSILAEMNSKTELVIGRTYVTRYGNGNGMENFRVNSYFTEFYGPPVRVPRVWPQETNHLKLWSPKFVASRL